MSEQPWFRILCIGICPMSITVPLQNAFARALSPSGSRIHHYVEVAPTWPDELAGEVGKGDVLAVFVDPGAMDRGFPMVSGLITQGQIPCVTTNRHGDLVQLTKVWGEYRYLEEAK